MPAISTNRKPGPVIGILAHVDAGKTTLSEALLYECGTIRKMGRVDTKDAFLDTDAMERARGITIYSKMARFAIPESFLSSDRRGSMSECVLLDTPGHADFGPEMERALSVLDMAVLLISAPDGVSAQVRLLMDLLRRYAIPAVIFVNKMDQIGEEDRRELRKKELLEEIRAKLTENAVDFSAGPEDADVQEQIALSGNDETLLERVMEGGLIPDDEIRNMTASRVIFPVLFGSALKMQGIGQLLSVLGHFSPDRTYGEAFSARVYKIAGTASGERETFLKVTGGSLAVRQEVPYLPRISDADDREEDGNPGPEDPEYKSTEETVREKITQIRVYNGSRFETVKEASAGMICAVTGLTKTYAGQGLGAEIREIRGQLVPPLTWEILLTQNTDPFRAYRLMKPIEEEEPMLRLAYDERKKTIHASLMGEVQREILKDTVKERCGLDILFGRPSVVYKETIAGPVEGVGHFEPLRHYAEVHLLIEPGEEGSGIVLGSACPTDVLARQYQNQILTALERRKHRGVLTGSELTDVRITLIGGRAHEKHTEGGDFRQAAGRALRQGLMMAENILLEPSYDFEMTLPQEMLGRALTDLSGMDAVFSTPDIEGDTALIAGTAPVTAIDAYQEQLTAYTKGEGRLTLRPGAYRPCRNAEKVVLEEGYDPELDRGQPSSSVFCSHGAGMIVPWYEVRDYMHVDTGWRPGLSSEEAALQTKNTASRAGSDSLMAENAGAGISPAPRQGQGNGKWDAYGRHIEKADTRSFKERESSYFAAEEELKAIFERTFGPVKRVLPQEKPREKTFGDTPVRKAKPKKTPEKEYLLVDGYNMIFAWENLRELAAKDIKAARDLLQDILADYAGFAKQSVILVFDAYKVADGQERIYRYHTIDVVFTKEAETADQYIEKAAHELRKQYAVTVATSDAVEQIIIFSAGARRLSAMDLLSEIVTAREAVREKITGDIQVRDGRLHAPIAEKIPAGWNGADERE